MLLFVCLVRKCEKFIQANLFHKITHGNIMIMKTVLGGILFWYVHFVFTSRQLSLTDSTMHMPVVAMHHQA